MVEDCGPVINPLIVEGQIHGALSHGIAEALGEPLVYDADGQLLTGTLMDYALPVAADTPSFVVGPIDDLVVDVRHVGHESHLEARPA